MLFASSTNVTLWDVWLYYKDGTHYLFYLANSRPDRPWDGIAMATSSDGVHFDDRGMVIKKADDAEYLGAGHTWKADDKYVFNFSECRNGTLEIFFAESDDLLHWERVPDKRSVSRMDPTWYSDGTEISDQRWDNIWVNPDEHGEGYYGYVTAVANKGPVGLQGTCASVVSQDGVVFETREPVIEPGIWPDKLEIGGVTPIDGKYYMFAALAEIPLGLDWARHHAQGVGGVYVLRSDHQEGPFELDPNQPPVLVSAPDHHSYFARFYPCGNEVLVAHHSLAERRFIATVYPKMGTVFAPLKKAQVRDGILSLHWWSGNEAMYGKQLPSSTDEVDARLVEDFVHDPDGTLTWTAPLFGQVALPYTYDFEKGVIIDADIAVESYDARPASAGIFVEGSSAWGGTNFILDNHGRFEVGASNGYTFRNEDGKSTAPLDKTSSHFRVLIRETFTEVYIDDVLVQCFALPATPQGRVGFIAAAGKATVSNISIHTMDV